MSSIQLLKTSSLDPSSESLDPPKDPAVHPAALEDKRNGNKRNKTTNTIKKITPPDIYL